MRDHLPALPPSTLALFIQQIQLLPITDAAKRQLEAMMTAASNPDAESPAVIMQTLSSERQINMEATMRELDTFTNDVARRGSVGLLAMDEAAFQALVDSAESE